MNRIEVIRQLQSIIDYAKDNVDTWDAYNDNDEPNPWSEDIIACNVAISTLMEVWGLSQGDIE